MGEGLGGRTVGVQAPGYTLPNGACTPNGPSSVFTVARRKVDLTKEYWNNVFQPSLKVWEAGGTPNPDVWCNKQVFRIARNPTWG